MESVDRIAQELGKTCSALGIKIVTAESCTGGLIAGTLTDVPGASAWLDRGFVTYSNEAKKAMLGVREETLTEFGAVSKETAEEMALGAVAHSGAGAAVSVTGIAGPGGGTAEKPVGTVCFGFAESVTGFPRCTTVVKHFDGDRASVRRQSVAFAVEELNNLLASIPSETPVSLRRG